MPIALLRFNLPIPSLFDDILPEVFYSEESWPPKFANPPSGGIYGLLPKLKPGTGAGIFDPKPPNDKPGTLLDYKRWCSFYYW